MYGLLPKNTKVSISTMTSSTTPVMIVRTPAVALSLSKSNNFLAIRELAYVCCKDPLLLTTSSAEYGRFIPLYLEVAHHALTASTWESNKESSAPGPAFLEVGNSWKASEGSEEDKGGFTAGRCVDASRIDMRGLYMTVTVEPRNETLREYSILLAIQSCNRESIGFGNNRRIESEAVFQFQPISIDTMCQEPYAFNRERQASISDIDGPPRLGLDQ